MEEMESIIDNLIASGRFSLWHPSSKGDLFLDYPALRTVQEFKDLNNPKKLLFVWFFACKTSRARELHDEQYRIKYALRAAWGEYPPKDVHDTYMKKQWGSAMDAAIAKMRSYEPEPRMRMKFIADQQIRKVQEMLETTSDKEMATWKEKDDYFSAVKSGAALIQQLQPLTEFSALGIVEKTEEQEEEEGEVMEWLHNQEDE